METPLPGELEDAPNLDEHLALAGESMIPLVAVVEVVDARLEFLEGQVLPVKPDASAMALEHFDRPRCHPRTLGLHPEVVAFNEGDGLVIQKETMIHRRCRFGLLMTLCVMGFAQPSPDGTRTLPSTNWGDRIALVDSFVKEAMETFHVQGLGLAVLAGDRVLICKGYGRDRILKGPFTPSSHFQIASNTKLFTAMAAGMLVAEGRLGWDQPIHEVVPSIRFARPELDTSVSLRDLLAHRTGIQRHDFAVFGFQGTRAEAVDKLFYLEPSAPLRQSFNYSNLQYVAVGHGNPIPSTMRHLAGMSLSTNWMPSWTGSTIRRPSTP